MKFRKENDSLGIREISYERYYGIQTLRAHENFDVSQDYCSNYKEYIYALGALKKASALANNNIGGLYDESCKAIVKASEEVMEGKYDHEFIIDVFQGGGGTSTNMNVNEIIANRANEILTGEKGYNRVNPNNHVNMGQSTNDVIPAAMKIGVYIALEGVINSVDVIINSLDKKAKEYKDVVKLGRTCIQDALPLTVGQEFGGYRSLMIRQKEKLMSAQVKCLEIPLGGTAVGTGMSALKGYHVAVFNYLREITKIDFIQDHDLFDGLQNADAYIDISSALKSLATGLSKIATDLRILSSGPRSGFGEINLPAVQPGSSIMPGKINPVMPELMNQICYQICGNDVSVTMAVEGGELDLNVWEPVFIKNVFESIKLLKNSIILFAEKCIDGITVNEEICKKYAENGLALSTVVSSLIDYETGSMVAKKAFKENKTIKDVVIELGIMSIDDAEKLLDPLMLSNKEKSGELLLNAIKSKK